MDNELEGSTGYVEGYVRHAIIANNPHYQCGAVRTAEFMTFQCDNCLIDLNISGTTVAEDTVQMYCNGIINATGACNDLTIRGNIRDVKNDVFYFNAGGKNINIDVVADNIGIAGTGVYLVNLNNTASTYDGLVVKGSVTSPYSTFTAVHRNSNNVVNYDISGLVMTGTYTPGATNPGVVYHNLNEQNQGTRRTVSGSYAGNGGAAVNIYLGYKPNSVSIYSNILSAIAISAISATTQVPATGITFTASGFSYQGIANNSGIIYSWIAN
ncbi:MAG TPA: hypothetical protein VIM42_04215 [Clostridium sp.]